ncbi:MAG: aromatic amino acid transport family protein [Legionellaceae bacterium]|nr:aromatic amino acid transport family protein [Legionellaceae bacterium]
MINSKLIGGILLIVGTSIGGGMLALPVSMAAVGVTNSIIFLFLCWLIMTSGALLVLEVNLSFPPGSNIITMAKSTLGLPGQMIAWTTSLVLLYTLLSAYISGGSDILNSLLQQIHINLPSWATSILFTGIFGAVIYNGINTVDYVNRGLMFGKLGIYLLLVLIISPHIEARNLDKGSLPAITGSLMILITSFGFASIVPTLREYFADDIQMLRRVIIYGSLIPLICYIVWLVVIMGTVEREGANGLLSLMTSEHAASGLTTALGNSVKNGWIHGFFEFFASICIVTAFLGVSLGLFDFIADGFKLKKKGHQGIKVLALTFLPPLTIVLVNPGIYLHALSYAGVCCVLFLLLLPIMMAWRGRKIICMKDHIAVVPGGQIGLIVMGCAGLALLSIAVIS